MMPAVTDGSQSEVEIKPVPRPRSKLQPMNSTADTTADTTSNTTKAVSFQLGEYPADYKTPCPVRPLPRTPLHSHKCMTSSKPTVDDGNHYMTISESPVTPPADSAERIHSPISPRPERPPPPSISYNRACCTMKLNPEPPADSTERIHSPTSPRPERPPPPSISYNRACSPMRLKPESCIYESQHSRCSYINSMQQPPVSPAVSKEEVNLYVNDSKTAPDRPAVPPRLGLSAPKSIPPPPSFTPPPPPSMGKPSDTVYSEIEHRPYLTILPEDVEKMGGCGISQQTIGDTEDINGMLRWLKRVSKSDFMGLPVFGLCVEEVMRSFSQRAMAVRKALRLYNLLMMKRYESLQNIITEFSSISDSLDKLKKKGKAMDIAGSTTGAVGGVTAVLGIVLAPVTFGTSLIATAVGAGMVASAGGMGAHTVIANKKTVNRMAVEKLVYEYKGNVVDLENCLSFILSGMNELRMHDIARLQRAGAQSETLKVAHLSQSVFNNMNKDSSATVSHIGGMSSERLLLAFIKELDQYFTGKDGLTLKKSHKSRFSVRVRLLAENLQDELYRMNRMWEMFG